MNTRSNGEISPTLLGVTFLTDIDIAKRYGVTRQTVWRWTSSNPEFPKPVKFSKGCTRWRLSDLERWEALSGEED